MSSDGAQSSESRPSRTLILQAIELLRPHAALPSTMPLHDVLYRLSDMDMVSEEVEQALRELERMCQAHRIHPAVPTLIDVLSGWVSVPALTLEDVLDANGGLVDGTNPIVEVQRRLTRARETDVVLRRRIEQLEQENRSKARLSNGLAGVGAMLLIFTILGWLAATEQVLVPWTPPQEIPSEHKDAN